MSLERYTAWAAQVIGQTFVGQGIGCTLEQRVVGPRVLTFILSLHDPSPRNLQTAQRLAATLEAHLQVDQVDLVKVRGRLHINIPNPQPGALRGPKLRGEGLAVPIGVNRRNDIVGLDFADSEHAHVLLVGPTGRGKSTTARTVALHLARQNSPDQVRLIVVGGDPGDWASVTALPHAWPFLLHADAPPVIAWLRRHVQDREAAGQRLPHLFLLLDDVGVIASAVGEDLAQLARQGRRVGVHLVLMAHATDKENLGDTLVAKNITRRLVYQAASAADAARDTGRGQTGAHELLGKGEAVSIGDGPAQAVTLARTTPDDLATLATQLATRYPAAPPAPWSETVKRPAPVPLRILKPDISGTTTAVSAVSDHFSAISTPAPAISAVSDPRLARLRELLLAETPQGEIMAELWPDVKPGGSQAYIAACREYRALTACLLKETLCA